MVQETCASFAREQMDPLMREADESCEVPQEVIAKGWELGLVGGSVPEEYGGFGEGLSALTGVIACEELAWGDLSMTIYLLAPTMLTYAVLDQGDEEQKKAYLPPYCEEEYRPASGMLVEPYYNFCASALKTTAVADGDEYVISGRKCLVPLAAQSDDLILFASASPGTGFSGVEAFLLKRETKGLKLGERERNLGLHALPTYPVELEELRLPASAKLGGERGSDFMRLLSRSRLALAALAVGMSRHATEHSRDYARERVAFGEPIGSRQAIAFMIAEMAIEVDAARLLVWEAAWRCDRGLDFFAEASMAKNYAAEVAMMCGDRAVQIMGGHGYVRDNPPELWFRNGRAFSTLEGMVMV